jgi:hypothetical protein
VNTLGMRSEKNQINAFEEEIHTKRVFNQVFVVRKLYSAFNSEQETCG